MVQMMMGNAGGETFVLDGVHTLTSHCTADLEIMVMNESFKCYVVTPETPLYGSDGSMFNANYPGKMFPDTCDDFRVTLSYNPQSVRRGIFVQM